MPEVKANIQAGRYEDILAAVQSPVIALTELVKNASDSCISKDDPIIVNIDTDQKVITITDFGIGISKRELNLLGEAGYSSKMVDGNTMSLIDIPLSGSKGIGILTAFFIADVMEIETYSIEDKTSYFLVWEKGNQKYFYEEIEREFRGTIVTLRNIDSEKLQMMLLPEEKLKLFMSSLRFFTNDSKLPIVKLIINGVEESYYPKETLESFFQRNKGANSAFIAKASFRYENNVLVLSYIDNLTGYYTFTEKSIDLSDKSSVDSFIRTIRAPEKGGTPIKSVCDSEVFMEHFQKVSIPSFSGEIYIWRYHKVEELDQWPAGVRIYINNYSLYRYLDKENDWLNLSEFSQNIKATNYKLKNTYGYLDITNYNEHNESLKISKERNDFVDSMAQRKFVHIMRDLVVGIFARIDVAVKNAPVQALSLRFNNVSIKVGESFDLTSAVICNHIGLDDIRLDYDVSKIIISEDWSVSTDTAGTYEINLHFDNSTYNFVITFKNLIPQFDLYKSSITIYKGNSANLRDYIDPSSCKDVTVESIIITSDSKETVIKNNLFDKNNPIGKHIILYKYEDYQRTLVVSVKELERQPGGGVKSPRIDSLFPKLDDLRKCSIKLPELVDAISSYYVQAPTLCMAAIRILIESSSKAFFKSMVDEEIHESFQGLVNKVINLRNCSPKSPDYEKYICVKGEDFTSKFLNISDRYAIALSKDVKTNINAHLHVIDLDMFVHNPDIIATDTTVYRAMQIFAPLLNYIFEVLLIEKC